MSDKKKSTSASPGLGGAIKDLVAAVGKAAAPKSVTQRKAREEAALREAEGNQRIYDGD
jgi:hypothetical protein